MRIDTQTPHVEPDWAQAFLLELRLRGVPGHRIGAALAEVEAHCAESGESAHSAFGDPTAYAVELAPTTVTGDSGWRRELATAVVGLAGMLVTLAAVGAWTSGHQVTVTTGSVVVLLLVGGGIVVAVRNADRLLRAAVRHWWVGGVAGMVLVVAFVGVLLLGRQTVATIPVAPALVLGLVLLAVNTVVALRSPDPADPVVGPDEAGGAGTLREDAVARGLERTAPWLFPLLTAVMAVPLLLI